MKGAMRTATSVISLKQGILLIMSDELPTKYDLHDLSRRGMVCYAVRCAMRVVHLTKHNPKLHDRSMACIEATTRFCLAASDDVAAAAVNAIAAANAAKAYAYDAALAAANADAAAADAAYAAADARAANAAALADASAADYVAANANAAYDAYAADADDYADATAKAKAAASADYQQLLKLTGHQVGKLGDPIEPGKNGPLGPLWPKRDDASIPPPHIGVERDETPLLKVYFDESSGITEEDELLVLEYINLLYQQQGQVGLKIVEDKRHVFIESKEVVPCR